MLAVQTTTRALPASHTAQAVSRLARHAATSSCRDGERSTKRRRVDESVQVGATVGIKHDSFALVSLTMNGIKALRQKLLVTLQWKMSLSVRLLYALLTTSNELLPT